jgi:hypothetical protein
MGASKTNSVPRNKLNHCVLLSITILCTMPIPLRIPSPKKNKTYAISGTGH